MMKHDPVRKRFSGDTHVAQEYTRDATKLLGFVKEQMGFAGLNQLSKQITLENGVVLFAASSHGQDEIRIYAPPQPKPKPSHKEEKRGEEPHPYLWVGARIMYEKSTNVPWGGFSLTVSEPGQNGIVVGQGVYWGNYLDSYSYASIAAPGDSSETPFDVAAQDAQWATRSWIPQGRHPNYISDRATDHIAYSEYGRMAFTKHLLRSYDNLYSTNSPRMGIRVLSPHDPLGTPEQLAARTFPTGYAETMKNLWEQVVVLDPDEGGRTPTSHRPEDREVLDILSQATGVSGVAMVLSGEYVIKVVAVGNTCAWSNVAAPNNYGWNEDCINYYDPIWIEIEVRVGKAPNTTTQRFEVEIERASEYYADLWPFGDTQGVVPQHADNIHRNCWWQGAILVDVLGGSIRKENYYVPDYVGTDIGCGITTPGTCKRTKWDIYVQIFQPYCAYATGSYSTEAATQVYGLQTNARQGIYGQLSIPSRTLDQVKAAAAMVINDTTGEGLYKYDVETNIFIPVTNPPDDATLNYDAGSYSSWEYIYRWQSLRACRGFAKVRLGRGSAVYAGYTFAGDPADVKNMKCCADPGHPML